MEMIGKGGRGRSRFWMLAVAVLAVCGALIPATTVPAYASTNELKFFWHADRTAPWREVVLGDNLCDQNPQMARNSNNTGAVISCEGPGNSLWFWWINDGSWTWNDEEVGGYGSAYSDPAITTNSAGTEIAAEGPGNSLWFWWNINGSPFWGAEQGRARHHVLGPGDHRLGERDGDLGRRAERHLVVLLGHPRVIDLESR